ncbi:MAG: 3-oxoacyl-ACP reductase family protein [Pseudomonadales bacterium]|nr:3-oxoacyl-ACP reductase family protein [Pseudomonadales bacterium]MDP6472923.1 3-oxoacyl-ACP reductase family protein [Pseudomonadales bacterium]MDP6826320.1 3-oxoacyl-ACP reductase family protein [Pseudomonadales bacterium]MDP6973251.1 3-oxoacyl-ACP reductase family protein [Pseudomonadales bacterium]
MSRPDGTVAFVTGATRGIGLAIVQQLAREGYFVVGSATTAEGAERLTQTLADKGLGVVMRLQDQGSIDGAFAAMANGPGTPLVLVNNAGITRDNVMLRMREEQWLDVIDTNVNGLYRVTKPALRSMLKARWGRIVNVSSVVARMGNPGQSNYVSSKAAIEGFTRSLAHELASRNITVNAVAPGFVDTDMTGELTDDQTAAMLARVPLGRMASPQDIASAVAFLAGDGAGYITGETLHVNGGLGMF